MAASSSNSNANRNSRISTSYDVFLSFSGTDTGLGFTDHLYNALVKAEFRTFREEDDIERGENRNSELEKAIQDSRFSIIVFSKEYGSSELCLFELETILKLKKTSDHVVLPLFYDVDPSDVSDQTGSFAEAFAKHDEQFNAEIGKVNQWRAALKEAAGLAGLELQMEADRHEAKFIQKVVSVVENRLRRTPLSVTPSPLVGVESQLKTITSWLEDGSTDVGILLISGIPGIGKTTIAKSVYNSNFNGFQRSAFLENIGEISRQPNGLVRLQKKLLSILTMKKVIIHNVSEGTNKIRAVVGSKRVFLVLDDVDHVDTLDAILGMRDWFCPGSKIMITTRRPAELLKAREVYKVHMVDELDEDGSLELFSWHAFGQGHPIEHYEQLSERVAHHCGGLPLALKILGRSLSCISIDYWESAIEKLEDIPHGEILEKLKISYDTLDEYDQYLFLDIACFFIGEDKDFIVTVLDGCGFHARVGILNLIDRYLITTDEDNRVRMHNLLRDMGREIIRRESPKEPGKRSRLWKDMDSYIVLTKKTGEETVEGIILHRDNILSTNSSKVVLETNAFAMMGNLRLLILSEVELSGSYESFPKGLRWLSGGSYESFPKGLRWLSWHGFPMHSIPDDFVLVSLVALDMCYSNLRRMWKIPKSLPLLKILNFGGSHHLTKTPDFSLLPKLERLILNECDSLVNVHESIVNLKRLVYLDMEDCKKLRNLPNICRLKSLETLIISGCSNLDNFQVMEFMKMESIKVFRANNTPMNRWLNNIGEVKSLTNHHLPRFLVQLHLGNCNLSDDNFFPLDFSNLSSLQILDLSGNPICRLPDCIRSLIGLNKLYLSDCDKLQSVVGLPRINEELRVTTCCLLEKVTFQSVSCIPRFIWYIFTRNIVEFEYWFKVEPIGSVDVEMINSLRLFNFDSLQDIIINFSYITWPDTKRLPIQGINELGIFNTFLPGKEIPSWFTHTSIDSSISFILPIVPSKIKGLNVAIKYVIDEKLKENPSIGSMTIEVHNNSKGVKWIYLPSFFGYLDEGRQMIWLSHWKLGNQLVGGDEMNVSIILNSDTIKFKECGIEVVYEQEEKMSTQENTTDPLDIEGICEYWRDNYEMKPGTYFLYGGPSSARSGRDQAWSSFKKAAIENWKRRGQLECSTGYEEELSEELSDEELSDIEEVTDEEEVNDEGHINEEDGEDETPNSQIPPVSPVGPPPPQLPVGQPMGGPPAVAAPQACPLNSQAVDDDHLSAPSHPPSSSIRCRFPFFVFLFLLSFSLCILGMLLGFFTKISTLGFAEENRQTSFAPT